MKAICYVKRLRLLRFRSLLGCDLAFSNPLFLVGKNGVGKSNLIDAFAFLSECMTLPLRTVFENRGGIQAVRYRTGKARPGNFGMCLDFGFPNGATTEGWYAFEIRAKTGYGFEIVREQCVVGRGGDRRWFDRIEGKFMTNVAGLQPAVEPEALALPIVGGSKEFSPVLRGLLRLRVFSIQPGAIRDLQEPDTGTTLKGDGSNLASVLQVLARGSEDKTKRLCQLLATVVPGTNGVRTIKHGKKLSLEFTQSWQAKGKAKDVHFEAFLMSDGTLRALGILTAFHQEKRPCLIAIEEPEATIHPEALSTILDLFRSFARETQIVVTTHSPELLDAKWIEPDNIRLVTWAQGVTAVCPLGASSVKALKDHLTGAGELLRANALREGAVSLFQEENLSQLRLFEDVQT